MKKYILSLFVAVGLIGSASAAADTNPITLVSFNGSKDYSSIASGFSSTPLAIHNEQTYYENISGYGNFPYAARSFLNPDLRWSDDLGSLSFSISSQDNFVITNISFTHGEFLFNNIGGYPSFNLKIQDSSNPIQIINIPYSVTDVWWGPVYPTSFSDLFSYTNRTGSVNIILEMGNSGYYGSPIVGVNNINVSGYTVVQSVPEPSTYALFGIGAIGMLMVMRRKKTA